MNYLYYIPLGLLPSFIWLCFYLRKDPNPEPRNKILIVFLWGMGAAVFAYIIERSILVLGNKSLIAGPLFDILYISPGVAIIEEVSKYLVIRLRVLKDRDFDEAIDAMQYMIIAALGFAGMENVLLFRGLQIGETAAIACLRFISATLLHALCSAIVGFFIIKGEFRRYFLFLGLAIAILLHAAYNFSIMKMPGNFKFLFIFVLLSGAAIFVSWGFNKLKRF